MMHQQEDDSLESKRPSNENGKHAMCDHVD